MLATLFHVEQGKDLSGGEEKGARHRFQLLIRACDASSIKFSA
jgi:hypothetical protein